MNFLAHAYLSFRQPEILVGNLVSDFVKGRSRSDYSPGIQNGIALHRAIDSFTDDHPLNAEARKLFRSSAGKYAGAFLDVVYDHFLAKDPIAFPAENLPLFSQWVYGQMEARLGDCPPRFIAIFPYMKKHDWLTHYREMDGLERSIQGLVHRAVYLDKHEPVWAAFQQQYDQFEAYYQRFFPELLLFVNDYFRKHLLQAPDA